MAMQQKLGLSARLSQRLILTPSLQQAIKLLQMSKLELVEEIQQELVENPVLEEALEELGIHPMARQQAYTLSGGERRRLEICRALASEPSFILLDEPFAGIDPIAVIDIQKIIAHLSRRGIGVLITDHNVRETLKITDRAYILRDGHVFRSGTPRELASDGDVRKVYLGEGFTLDERPEHHGGVHER